MRALFEPWLQRLRAARTPATPRTRAAAPSQAAAPSWPRALACGGQRLALGGVGGATLADIHALAHLRGPPGGGGGGVALGASTEGPSHLRRRGSSSMPWAPLGRTATGGLRALACEMPCTCAGPPVAC